MATRSSSRCRRCRASASTNCIEQLQVVAELEELTANPTGRAKGIVIEAQLDKGRGPVATVLVDKGELKVGDPIVAGAAWGKVRAMINDKGEQVKTAGPSTPVQVLGLSTVPEAGDEFRAAPDEKTARTVGESREQRLKAKHLREDARVKTGTKLEDIFAQIQSGEKASRQPDPEGRRAGFARSGHRVAAASRA